MRTHIAQLSMGVICNRFLKRLLVCFKLVELRVAVLLRLQSTWRATLLFCPSWPFALSLALCVGFVWMARSWMELNGVTLEDLPYVFETYGDAVQEAGPEVADMWKGLGRRMSRNRCLLVGLIRSGETFREKERLGRQSLRAAPETERVPLQARAVGPQGRGTRDLYWVMTWSWRSVVQLQTKLCRLLSQRRSQRGKRNWQWPLES